MCQLLMFGVVALSPGLFLVSLRLSLETLWPLLDAPSSVYTDVAWSLAVTLYVVFVIRHRWINYEAALFYWLLFQNAITVMLAFGTTAYSGIYQQATKKKKQKLFFLQTPSSNSQYTSSVAQDGNPNFWNDPSSASAITYYLVIFILFCTLFPVFISLFTGGGSVYHMCRNIVPFYLFLPTLVSTFGAYAFARTFDLTWGNRPPSEIEAVTNATKRQAVEKAQTKLKEQSQASCTFIVILNLVIVFLGLMTIHINWVVLGAVACIFFPSLVQMIISFFWYVRFFIVRCLRQVLFFLSVIFCCKCDYCCWCCRTKIFRSDKRLDAQLSWQRDSDLEAATKDSQEDSPETSKTNLINQA